MSNKKSKKIKQESEESEKRIIKQININKANGQLLITVPKNSHLKAGDYVEITKVPEKQ